MIKKFGRKLRDLLGKRPAALQVAALCLDPENGKVLLITSRGTGRWVIPKGWPMPGLSLAKAAAQEAWEEAGVRGTVSETALGTFEYDKEQDRGFSIPVIVQVFPMTVDKLTRDFPEESQRKRRWHQPDEAARLVAEPGLKAILRKLPVHTS